jgi:hypothetical protein
MDIIYIILSLIMVIFAILQIVLFFKIWGMTKNILEIKNKIIPDTGSVIAREIHKKNPDIMNILYDHLWADLERAYKQDLSYSRTINEYKILYQRAGIEFPSEIENIKNDDCYRLFYEGKLE